MLNFDNEIWKDVKGFENRYQISTYGNVRSIQTNHGKYQEELRTQYIRSATCKYYYVQLWIKDCSHTKAVHRVVAETFIPNLDNKPMVNHKDGNKLNNNVCNLEWVTCSENHLHAFRTGLRNADHAAKRFLGKKYGNTSVYHNVSWDSTRKKWMASLKNKAKTVFQKRFDCEIQAALYVNEMLDLMGFSDRPRNIIK